MASSSTDNDDEHQVSICQYLYRSTMGTLVHCIRSCMDEDDGERSDAQHYADDYDPAYNNNDEPPRQSLMQRDPQTDDGLTECCQPQNMEDNPFARFWHNLLHKDGNYQQIHPSHVMTVQELLPARGPLGGIRRSDSMNLKPVSSPLRIASSFDSSSNVISIKTEEIVLPGSLLQQEMADKMKQLDDEVAQGDECVICLECFSEENPRMPTECACGTDKTYFHLPCLYQWTDRCKECPSCRQTLTWEEF